MPTFDPLEQSISAAEANRNFSRLLREVQAGHSYIVTSHGRPVARLSPCAASEADARGVAWAALMERLRDQPAMDIGPWTRDELYER